MDENAPKRPPFPLGMQFVVAGVGILFAGGIYIWGTQFPEQWPISFQAAKEEGPPEQAALVEKTTPSPVPAEPEPEPEPEPPLPLTVFADSGAGNFLSLGTTIRIKKNRCQGGDLDTMFYVVESPQTEELLFSVEEIGRNTPIDSLYMSLNDLSRGLERTVKIDNSEGAKFLGLFICRDREKTGRCQDKSLETHAALSRKLAETATEEAARNKDHILYFQNLLHRRHEWIAYSNEDMSTEVRADLEKHYIQTEGVAAPLFESSWSFDWAMRSTPATSEGGRLILNLSMMDPTCF